jgi:hypothetical protein
MMGDVRAGYDGSWLFTDRWGRTWRVFAGEHLTHLSSTSASVDGLAGLLEETLSPWERGNSEDVLRWLAVHEAVVGASFDGFDLSDPSQPLPAHVGERLREDLFRAFEWRQLRCELVQPAGGVPHDRPDLPDEPPAPPDVRLAPYELVIVDETDRPLADLEVRLATPSGEMVLTTGADGAVRTDAVAGTASAVLVGRSRLRAALSGRERSPRRTRSFDPNVHVRSIKRAAEPIDVPSGKPQKLMIATRFDFYDIGHAPSWGDLVLVSDGPWSFEDAGDDSGLSLFQAHADGTGAEARVISELEPAKEYVPPRVDDLPIGAQPDDTEPPPAPDPTWLDAPIDAIHDALVRADFDFLLEFLRSLPVDRPPVDATLPPPIVESLLFAKNLAEVSIEDAT